MPVLKTELERAEYALHQHAAAAQELAAELQGLLGGTLDTTSLYAIEQKAKLLAKRIKRARGAEAVVAGIRARRVPASSDSPLSNQR